MAVTVEINLGYEFDVKAKASEVFAVLSDVPSSASHFPKVDQLVDLGGGAYRWEMEKIGIASITLQTVYASKYTSNKVKGTVSWTPIKGEGNALGGRQLEDHRQQKSHQHRAGNPRRTHPAPARPDEDGGSPHRRS